MDDLTGNSITAAQLAGFHRFLQVLTAQRQQETAAKSKEQHKRKMSSEKRPLLIPLTFDYACSLSSLTKIYELLFSIVGLPLATVYCRLLFAFNSKRKACAEQFHGPMVSRYLALVHKKTRNVESLVCRLRELHIYFTFTKHIVKNLTMRREIDKKKWPQ